MPRYARRTDRLAASEVRTGLSAGAEAESRLLGDLGMPTSRDTVLRLLHRHPLPEAETHRVLGVDDHGAKAACGESGIAALVSFVEGLRRDAAAVHAALEEPWSSGQAEGQINRLKKLTRQMYGRAGFELLRKRVLCAS